jgi:hypothetical protein
MSTYLALKTISAPARQTGLWISLDMKTSQWKVIRKIKRAALKYPKSYP